VPVKTLKEEDLEYFTGTENWYRHGLVRSITYTDGAKYVADSGGAYWILDEIALAQKFNPQVKGEPFQVWKLAVRDNAGVLTCDDGNGNIVFTKKIPFTDFPLPMIAFYFADNVILLPSEYDPRVKEPVAAVTLSRVPLSLRGKMKCDEFCWRIA
jgi:hypothetical protein